MLKVKYPNSENFCNPVNSVNRFCNFLTRSLQRGCLATGEKISELQVVIEASSSICLTNELQERVVSRVVLLSSSTNVLQAKEIEIKQEAIAESRLGVVNDKVLELKNRAKDYFNHCFQTAYSLNNPP